MRASTRREFVAGAAGRIECAVDQPDGAARGVALIALSTSPDGDRDPIKVPVSLTAALATVLVLGVVALVVVSNVIGTEAGVWLYMLGAVWLGFAAPSLRRQANALLDEVLANDLTCEMLVEEVVKTCVDRLAFRSHR